MTMQYIIIILAIPSSLANDSQELTNDNGAVHRWETLM